MQGWQYGKGLIYCQPYIPFYPLLPQQYFQIPCKGIQDSLKFWIPRIEFRVLVTGFQPLTIESAFWIANVNWIPNSKRCIQDSKAQDYGLHKQKFPGFWIPLHGAIQNKKEGWVFPSHLVIKFVRQIQQRKPRILTTKLIKPLFQSKLHNMLIIAI